ncbi:MAG TPA: hypothetical protein VG935_01685 [Patescibacteria group bacterium]|nr:hypothetical protein [Patescibacteria group bacterium]
MKAERIILSLIAIFVGLLVAGVAFYLYQMTKQVPASTTGITIKSPPTPTPNSADFLTVDSPGDESLTDRKTITISGKTLPGSTIVISTEGDDQVVQPTTTGQFSVTETIADGTNLISITSIFPDGTEQHFLRTVSYTTEDF